MRSAVRHTLSRRQLLLGASGVLATACSRDRTERGAPVAAESADEKPARKGLPPGETRRETREGVELVSLFTGGADESSPVLVAVHGRGDRPEAWVPALQAFPGRAHVVIPRGLDPSGDGYSWFPLSHGISDRVLAEAVAAAEERLYRAVSSVAAGRRLVMSGFSQGGMLSFAMAARRGEAVAFAAPIAGMCPAALIPEKGVPVAPLVAFHGTADPVIPFASGLAAVEAFRARGHLAEMRPYDGVVHALPPSMRSDVYAELARRLAG